MGNNDDIGLVFAGGGGKGAYQIGAWKYLAEKKIDKRVSALSGTSVGALNAALFSGSTLEKAEDIWLSINRSQILTNKISVKEIVSFLTKASLVFEKVNDEFDKYLAIAIALSKTILNSGVFSREGLIELIDNGVDFDRLKSSPLPTLATATSFPKASAVTFDLRDYSKDDIKTILLASSAIPLIFNPVEFQSLKLYDGGLPIIGENVPVSPLYNIGIRTFIVVHLKKGEMVKRSKYPGAVFYEIIPSVDLGNLVSGTLDFSPTGSKWRMEQGYNDAKALFERCAPEMAKNIPPRLKDK